MATKFTPINQRKKAADIRHVPSRLPDVSPGSPPMSPLSPPPSWFNDEDMECPHTPIRTQAASLLAPSTSSPLGSKSNHTERSSPSPLSVGQGLAPSTLLFPHLPAPALQKNALPTARKRDSEELGTQEVEHGPKAARRKTQKTFTQDEETASLTPVSNMSESPQPPGIPKTGSAIQATRQLI
ncbi:hypothetical protein GE21DRAFT_2044 [Neurospora crassa]|uniref:Uncharacterized protein n=1 Tax=Neurospora crassa (strain ATCC 24698 / 74-OR23-1A / CBS 708.71 / DSM 1257 / FGSC 987) TaxID=367110 RepID=V5IRE1_NEUCR|nr:hypothetical protein NCU16444 [Neurospora crassa OR74A]ESA44284.1 hypothetical protein NCU16444 [Neurospora crassa OR74A]KHE89784.1 hypothetical protein GE21DRAFT_2044 [Neurospora crassa]|eukprot:XP_011393412.1 hypothetical protein NCU16444 [Neurospora crassa OR74A]